MPRTKWIHVRGEDGAGYGRVAEYWLEDLNDAEFDTDAPHHLVMLCGFLTINPDVTEITFKTPMNLTTIIHYTEDILKLSKGEDDVE
jgi:hypothetical protein